jgi:hypothetical protein
VIVLSVQSDSTGWANRTLSQLEEQVERTRPNNLQGMVLLVGILIITMVFLLALLPINFDSSHSMWLRNTDLDRVNQLVSQDRPINDEESREITTMQLRNLLETYRPNNTSPQKTKRQLCVGIPGGVVVICAIGLLFCYPSAVFLWGDEKDRYANLLQRRKTLWGIIISIALTGVLANLLFAGVMA